MGQQSIGLGATPEDGNGDGIREGGVKIDANFDELYTRGIIQSKSFLSPSTSTIQNSNSAAFVDTDLTVSITTRSATSKLRVTFSAAFGTGNTTQTGIRGHIQKNVDSAGWVNVLFGNQTVNFRFRDPDTSSADDSWPITSMTQIDSPGLASVVQFKVTFSPVLNGVNVDYLDDQGIRIITVDEILET